MPRSILLQLKMRLLLLLLLERGDRGGGDLRFGLQYTLNQLPTCANRAAAFGGTTFGATAFGGGAFGGVTCSALINQWGTSFTFHLAEQLEPCSPIQSQQMAHQAHHQEPWPQQACQCD